MIIKRIAYWTAVALATWSCLPASTANAQEPTATLAQAKTVYASAAYEEALAILDTIHSKTPAADTEEVAAYQVFCLLALGRTDEARHATEALVRIDPLYRPSEAQASPRVLSFFDDVRRPLLPQIVRQTYAQAKTDFDQKNLPVALTEFDRVIALVDDMAAADDGSAADLKTLASGFRDLAKSASAAAAAPAPATPPAPDPPVPAAVPVSAAVDMPTDATNTSSTAAPAAAPETPNDPDKVYGPEDAGVKPPVEITKDMPPWTPANSFEKNKSYTGVLEVVIDERGHVTSASMRTSAVSSYDSSLLRAAGSWRYKPATRNGAPVKYRLHVRIQLGR
jgi:TonB family protein